METLETLKKQIKAFIPGCEQEIRDQAVMLAYMEKHPGVLNRTDGTAHFTASAWIRNPSGTKVLMLYHNIYQSWSWAGGHADGEAALLKTALREVAEETGLKLENIKVITPEIFSLEILTVDGHMKRGAYVPSHLHYNLTYLFEAEETQELRPKLDENSGVRWIDVDKVSGAVSELWMMQWIYRKLLTRMMEE